MELREAAQMALDALEHGLPIIEDFGGKEQLQIQHKAISALYEALRAALAQPEQEPDEIERIMLEVWQDVGDPQFPHIAPPQRERILCGCGDQIMPDDGAECGTCVTARNAVKREWQGLTDEERKEIIRQQKDFWGPVGWELECAKAIEAKLMEKNFDRPS